MARRAVPNGQGELTVVRDGEISDGGGGGGGGGGGLCIKFRDSAGSAILLVVICETSQRGM